MWSKFQPKTCPLQQQVENLTARVEVLEKKGKIFTCTQSCWFTCFEHWFKSSFLWNFRGSKACGGNHKPRKWFNKDLMQDHWWWWWEITSLILYSQYSTSHGGKNMNLIQRILSWRNQFSKWKVFSCFIFRVDFFLKSICGGSQFIFLPWRAVS